MPAPPSSDPKIAALARQLDAVPPSRLREPARWRGLAERRDRARWPLGRVQLALSATTVACVVTVTVVLLVSGSSSVDQAQAALPVFRRPVVDASPTRAYTPALARLHARYADARAIATVNGAGYVMPAEDGRVCLVLPDKVGGYGESCATAARVATGDLHVALIDQHSGAMVAVVPDGTTDAVLHRADGTDHPLDVTDGVITAAATGTANVTYRVAGRTVSVGLDSPIKCLDYNPDASYSREELARDARKAGIPMCQEP